MWSFRASNLRAMGAAAVLAAAPLLVSAADTSLATADVDPASTKVLLLTPIDATASAATAGPVRRQIMRLCQQREFIGRRFTVLSEAAAATACATVPALKIDSLADRSADVLDQLAMRAGVDWIASIGLRDIAVDDLDPPNVSIWFVRCTVTLQVRDARKKEWLANRSYTGRIFASGPPPELFLDALDATTGEALATVLWPYTVVVPVSRNGGIVDYLKGATGPVIGHPATIFSGWNATAAVAK